MSESSILSESVPGSKRQNRWAIWLVFLILAGAYLLVSHPHTKRPAVPWLHNLNAGLDKAEQGKQFVLIGFYAVWCGPCKTMDRNVFSKAKVAEALTNWVPIKIDVDKQAGIAERYDVKVIPTFVILSPDGRILNRLEVSMTADEFIESIKSVEKAKQ